MTKRRIDRIAYIGTMLEYETLPKAIETLQDLQRTLLAQEVYMDNTSMVNSGDTLVLCYQSLESDHEYRDRVNNEGRAKAKEVQLLQRLKEKYPNE